MEETLVDFLHIRIYVSLPATITPSVTFDKRHTRHGTYRQKSFAAVRDVFSRNTHRFKDLYPISSSYSSLDV
jgi:hypothetical protein